MIFTRLRTHVLILAILSVMGSPAIASDASFCERALVAVAGSNVDAHFRELYRQLLHEISSSQVSERDFLPNSIGYWYLVNARAGRLIGQTDPSFVRQGFVLPEGGLCATTCGLNFSIAAISRLKQTSDLNIPYEAMMAFFLNDIQETLKYDPRLGARPDHVAMTVRTLWSKISTRSGRPLFFDTSSFVARGVSPTAMADVLRDGSTVIAANILIRGGASKWHAINILRIKIPEQTVIVSDPQLPNAIRALDYYLDAGSGQMNIIWNGQLAPVGSFITMRLQDGVRLRDLRPDEFSLSPVSTQLR